MASVKVYSTRTCPWCDKMKAYLKEKGIPFDNIDVTSDPAAQKEMIEKSGQMGVPVTELNGTIIIGYDKNAVNDAISQGKEK